MESTDTVYWARSVALLLEQAALRREAFTAYLQEQAERLRQAMVRLESPGCRGAVVVRNGGLAGLVGCLLAQGCSNMSPLPVYTLGSEGAVSGLRKLLAEVCMLDGAAGEVHFLPWGELEAQGPRLLLLDCTGCYSPSGMAGDTLLAHLERGASREALVLSYGPPAGVELDNVDFDWVPYVRHGYRGVVTTGFPTACEFSPTFCDLDPLGQLVAIQDAGPRAATLRRLMGLETHSMTPAKSPYVPITGEMVLRSIRAYTRQPGCVLMRLSRHKNDMGRLLIVAGSPTMCGAMLLATQAALSSGAGVIEVVTPESLHPQLNARHPEAMAHASQDAVIPPAVLDRQGRLKSYYTSILIGPGLGSAPTLRAHILAWLRVADGRPVVLDADALNALGPLDEAFKEGLEAFVGAPIVITPHLGEFRRLFPGISCNVEIDRSARQLAGRTCWTVVLKQASTRVYHGGVVSILPNPRVPGMATGGSGDVLSGLLAGLLAWSQEPALASTLAVYLHAQAGHLVQHEVGDLSLTASRLAERLPAALQRTLQGVLEA